MHKKDRNPEIRVTDYFHIMDSHESILEIIRSTGLKPYQESLEDETQKGISLTGYFTISGRITLPALTERYSSRLKDYS